MEHRLAIHIVDGDSRSRAEQARIAFTLGHHAEVYSDIAELLARPPREGIVLARQRAMEVSLRDLFDKMGKQGIWLPVIVCDEEPQIEQVVGAIKNGALDYLQLPLEAGRLARSIARVVAEADAHGRARWCRAEARRRVAALSRRERQVLEWLAVGSSNKIIARELEISPRTVEIHRANMMTKLQAAHAAEAVRVWLQSELESTVREGVIEPEAAGRRGLMLQPNFVEMIKQRMPDVVIEAEGGADDKEAAATATPRRSGSK